MGGGGNRISIGISKGKSQFLGGHMSDVRTKDCHKLQVKNLYMLVFLRPDLHYNPKSKIASKNYDSFLHSNKVKYDAIKMHYIISFSFNKTTSKMKSNLQ